jgi:para-aminobenzoate synthetase component I
LSWFVPKITIMVQDNTIFITANGHEAAMHAAIENTICLPITKLPKVTITPSQTEAEYIAAINALKYEIKIGNCYEVNYCQHFSGQHKNLNPIETFLTLNNLSPNPFAACYKNNDNWLFCASPERFLTLNNTAIYSQPIKGTSKRILDDALADNEAKTQLQNHFKERAENIMVVDLVRNDMSRICKAGSVIVDELCAIYTYPQVHQLISSIKGQLKPSIDFVAIIKALFPMGSMTGAPKYKVMQLIEKHETQKRGLFSGSVGFISPGGNADLNVVIRSLFYNTTTGNLSFFTGSGITHYSNPEAEYEECMLKAKAIMALFE